MADTITCTTNEAIHFLNARGTARARNTLYPFGTGHLFKKLDRKLFAELKEYEEDRVAKCEELCEKDADGKPKKLANGNFVFSEDGTRLLNEALTPLLAESITVTNVRKVTVAEMGNVQLTDAEQLAFAPFVEDDAPAEG